MLLHWPSWLAYQTTEAIYSKYHLKLIRQESSDVIQVRKHPRRPNLWRHITDSILTQRPNKHKELCVVAQMLKAFLFHIQRCFWYFWLTPNKKRWDDCWNDLDMGNYIHRATPALGNPCILLVLCNIHYVVECCNTPNLSRRSWQNSFRKYFNFVLRKKYKHTK